jgi:hypothetical protein
MAAPLVAAAAGDVPQDFEVLTQSVYLIEPPRAKSFECECSYTPGQDDDAQAACGEGCINRLLFVECKPNRYACIRSSKGIPHPPSLLSFATASLERL